MSIPRHRAIRRKGLQTAKAAFRYLRQASPGRRVLVMKMITAAVFTLLAIALAVAFAVQSIISTPAPDMLFPATETTGRATPPPELVKINAIRAIIEKTTSRHFGKTPTIRDGIQPGIDLATLLTAARQTTTALAHLEQQQAQEALEPFRSSLKLNPWCAPAWHGLGRAYLTLQMYPEAEQALQSAVLMDSFNPYVLNDYGVALLQNGHIVSAENQFAQALSIKAEFSEALYNRTLTLHALERADDALQALRRYLRLQPEDVSMSRLKAYIELQLEQWDEALQTLENAIAHVPDRGGLHLDAAAVAAHGWYLSKVRKHLIQAAEQSSPDIVLSTVESPAFSAIRITEEGQELFAEIKSRLLTREERFPSPAYTETPLPLSLRPRISPRRSRQQARSVPALDPYYLPTIPTDENRQTETE